MCPRMLDMNLALSGNGLYTNFVDINRYNILYYRCKIRNPPVPRNYEYSYSYFHNEFPLTTRQCFWYNKLHKMYCGLLPHFLASYFIRFKNVMFHIIGISFLQILV